jgi:hypothetical protein
MHVRRLAVASARADSPTSGIDSLGQIRRNGGWICGRQRGSQLTNFGLPIYEFTDHGLPAS